MGALLPSCLFFQQHKNTHTANTYQLGRWARGQGTAAHAFRTAAGQALEQGARGGGGKETEHFVGFSLGAGSTVG